MQISQLILVPKLIVNDCNMGNKSSFKRRTSLQVVVEAHAISFIECRSKFCLKQASLDYMNWSVTNRTFFLVLVLMGM